MTLDLTFCICIVYPIPIPRNVGNDDEAIKNSLI